MEGSEVMESFCTLSLLKLIETVNDWLLIEDCILAKEVRKLTNKTS
jgi:hypothetical protein